MAIVAHVEVSSAASLAGRGGGEWRGRAAGDSLAPMSTISVTVFEPAVCVVSALSFAHQVPTRGRATAYVSF